MGDGSARRSAAAPGYLDERAEPFDAAVEQAFRDGDLSALTALDPDLARDLLASGRPAWQALAGALLPAPAHRVLYSAAPFGVAYLVATLTPATDNSKKKTRVRALGRRVGAHLGPGSGARGRA